MYLVWLLFISLFENEMNDWLLVKSGIGVKSGQKSLASLISHIPLADVNDPATNLASIDDLVTSPCFFNAHDIGAPLRVKIYLVVNFRSPVSPEKSGSVKSVRLYVYSSIPFPSCLYVIP